MTRKTERVVAVFLVATFAVLGGFVLQSRSEAATYRRLLTLGYQHSFAEMTDQLEGLNAALQKGQYATSPALLSALCAEAYSRASAAQVALGELPYSHVELEQTAAFLAKAGDYAYTLGRQAVSAGSATPEERAAIAGLSEISRTLTDRLNQLRAELNYLPLTLETVLEAEERLAAAETGTVLAGTSFRDMELEFPELPTLLYDGPFSQHLTNQSPKYLEGKSPVDEETARRAAAGFLEVEPSLLTLTSLREGNLPGYGFSMEQEKQTLWIEVSRQGGVVMELLSSRLFGSPQILPEAAMAIAKDFLAERNFPSMAATYTVINGSLMTISFASMQDDILCYPDLIKVTVALDTGEVTGFEAQGFLTHHAPRNLPTQAVSQAQAQAVLAPELSVKSYRLAVIPTAGKQELFCHEFTCETPDGRHILVYVNAATGREEKILLLLEDETGTLVL